MDVGELAMLLTTMQIEPVSIEKFQETAAIAQSMMGKLDQEQQLFLYGLFKQSINGDNNSPKPESKLSPDYYKWEAWTSFQGFPKEDAAKAYVYLVTQLQTDLSSGDGKKELSGWGTAVSTLYNAKHSSDLEWKESEKIFNAVVNNDIEGIKLCLAEEVNVNVTDEQGMTPLHYAADRGNEEVCKLLLEHEANINAIDNDYQTPLMYAVLCEHKNIVSLLIEKGADISLKNNDGESVLEFIDLSKDIKTLLLKQ